MSRPSLAQSTQAREKREKKNARRRYNTIGQPAPRLQGDVLAPETRSATPQVDKPGAPSCRTESTHTFCKSYPTHSYSYVQPLAGETGKGKERYHIHPPQRVAKSVDSIEQHRSNWGKANKRERSRKTKRERERESAHERVRHPGIKEGTLHFTRECFTKKKERKTRLSPPPQVTEQTSYKKKIQSKWKARQGEAAANRTQTSRKNSHPEYEVGETKKNK